MRFAGIFIHSLTAIFARPNTHYGAFDGSCSAQETSTFSQEEPDLPTKRVIKPRFFRKFRSAIKEIGVKKSKSRASSESTVANPSAQPGPKSPCLSCRSENEPVNEYCSLHPARKTSKTRSLNFEFDRSLIMQDITLTCSFSHGEINSLRLTKSRESTPNGLRRYDDPEHMQHFDCSKNAYRKIEHRKTKSHETATSSVYGHNCLPEIVYGSFQKVDRFSMEIPNTTMYENALVKNIRPDCNYFNIRYPSENPDYEYINFLD
ncbi:hypothetical protein ENBRE01_0139 [Enteropsectra breve]|nr:hypothetical protein ENBRE01_0139 [Enteropsectra breve]